MNTVNSFLLVGPACCCSCTTEYLFDFQHKVHTAALSHAETRPTLARVGPAPSCFLYQINNYKLYCHSQPAAEGCSPLTGHRYGLYLDQFNLVKFQDVMLIYQTFVETFQT